MMAQIATTPVMLQERDLVLFRELLESRIMTIDHITALHFAGRKHAAKRRLHLLKGAGFIAERKRRVNERSILFLTHRSLEALRERGELSRYPSFTLRSLERRAQVSEMTIKHELEIMDFKAALHSALASSGQFSLAAFLTWPLLYEFDVEVARGGTVRVKPDGFVRIHERERDGGLSEHTFFFELDRSTEALDTLIERAGSYLEYYRSGGFAVRNGASASDFKDYPFRTLILLKSLERRNNVAARLLESTPPILTHVYLSTLKEALVDPLGKVWICPADYRAALSETHFGIGVPRRNYRRLAIREEVVEERITKRRICCDEPQTNVSEGIGI